MILISGINPKISYDQGYSLLAILMNLEAHVRVEE